MSATQTQPPGNDPSMEDILASIRRILSEEDGPEAPPATAAPDEPGSNVLILNEAMLVRDTPAPEMIEPPVPAELPPAPMPAADVPPAAAAPVLLPVPRPAEPAIDPEPPQPEPEPVPMNATMAASFESSLADTGLASPETEAAAAGSVSSLIRALTSDRTAQVHSGGPTIADLVREEIRPLLKAWLDTNLPPLVERMVRAEIERVIARAAA